MLKIDESRKIRRMRNRVDHRCRYRFNLTDLTLIYLYRYRKPTVSRCTEELSGPDRNLPIHSRVSVTPVLRVVGERRPYQSEDRSEHRKSLSGHWISRG